MRKIFFLILVFFASTAFAQIGQPKISAMHKKFDFGKVAQHRFVSHDFIIYNTGTSPLKIKNVKSSCGCTVAKPAKNEIAPGESAKISVTFNTDSRTGNQRKHIYIYSNDPANPEFRLSITARIVKDKSLLNDSPKIQLSTNRYNFGVVKEGEKLKLKVKVKNAGKKPLHIKEVQSSCGCTAALLSSKVLKPDETGILNITFDTAKRVGKISRTVSLLSDDPENPMETITLFVDIKKGK